MVDGIPYRRCPVCHNVTPIWSGSSVRGTKGGKVREVRKVRVKMSDITVIPNPRYDGNPEEEREFIVIPEPRYRRLEVCEECAADYRLEA